ncbi:Tc5 transposase DNA-binding domain-containing protein [Hirsutella rhossiliensis]|uniref:Tc5 transposase DNA-binding domain-containing protein n=1 Tax=Hirsutella rhossiliensis TaxID=111463 RepID=A0A9P8MW10_9HYPO|nr:tc5 transposase DNA-binding domain-containing protein [Hirsutella rhossiliensis]KAH0961271.1 tc5 transposase DNA-binding domain-containing protein [Hirsutella rhossiliensis]
MSHFQPIQRERAAKAARDYLEGASQTRTARANPPRVLTINELALKHKTNEGLVKKYIGLLRANQALPSGGKGGRPTALTDAEEKSLVSYASFVEGTPFALTEACLINKANFIRQHRRQGPTSKVSRSWLTRFKRRHPELTVKKARIQEVSRASAELEVDELEAWFQEYQAVIKELAIMPENLWNFDETPLQLGSSSFEGHTIEGWFGYPATITREGWEGHEQRCTFYTRMTKTVFRLLVMDGFAAHEDPEFIWYCDKFEIVPFKLPSHTSHLLQP